MPTEVQEAEFRTRAPRASSYTLHLQLELLHPCLPSPSPASPPLPPSQPLRPGRWSCRELPRLRCRRDRRRGRTRDGVTGSPSVPALRGAGAAGKRSFSGCFTETTDAPVRSTAQHSPAAGFRRGSAQPPHVPGAAGAAARSPAGSRPRAASRAAHTAPPTAGPSHRRGAPPFSVPRPRRASRAAHSYTNDAAGPQTRYCRTSAKSHSRR